MAARNDRDDLQAHVPAVLSAEELDAEEAFVLPDREALSLLDPNLLGGAIVGGPTAGPAPTDGSPLGSPLPTDGSQAPAPAATDGTQMAGQSTSDSLDLTNRFMPNDAGSQPYSPSTSSSAES